MTQIHKVTLNSESLESANISAEPHQHAQVRLDRGEQGQERGERQGGIRGQRDRRQEGKKRVSKGKTIRAGQCSEKRQNCGGQQGPVPAAP